MLLGSYHEVIASKEEVKRAVNNDSNYKRLSLEVIPMFLNRYKVKVKIEWKKVPKVRKWDILAVSFENNNDYTIIFSTTKATQKYKAECTANDELKTKTETLHYTYFDHQGHFNFRSDGIALKQNLKNDWICEDNFFSDDYYRIVELTQELEFIVEKNSSHDSNKFSAKAYYTHNKSEQSDFSIGDYHFFIGLEKFRIEKDTSSKLSLDDFGIDENGKLIISDKKRDFYDGILTVDVQLPIVK
jgi:hypothetical protein